MFSETATILSKLDRPPVYYRALLHLATVLDPIQSRRFSARELAEATGMAQASATRALAMLEADRVIFATGSTAAKSRRLSRQLFSMSSSERWAEAQELEPDPVPEDARGR